MTDLVVRASILVGGVALAWLAVALAERRRGAGAAPTGVTLVTGPDCRLCDAALQAARRAGLEVTEVDVRHPVARRLGVRSLPTLVVADPGGRIRLRRSGRAAVSEIPRLAREVA